MLRNTWGKPHMRGDGPTFLTTIGLFLLVNPTCVGMDRLRGSGISRRQRKPHMRGDGPKINARGDDKME